MQIIKRFLEYQEILTFIGISNVLMYRYVSDEAYAFR